MGEMFSGTKKVLNGLDMVPDRRRQNQRQHPRFQVNFDTELQFENVSYQCTMVDISQKGCRIMSEKPIPNITEEVIVKFIVPKQLDSVFAKGKIKWKNQIEEGFFILIEFGRPIPNFDDLIG